MIEQMAKKSDFEFLKEFAERCNRMSDVEVEVNYTDADGREEFPEVVLHVLNADNIEETIHVFFCCREGSLVNIMATITDEEGVE